MSDYKNLSNSFRTTTETISQQPKINDNKPNSLFCSSLFDTVHSKINTKYFPPSQFPFLTRRRSLQIGGKIKYHGKTKYHRKSKIKNKIKKTK